MKSLRPGINLYNHQMFGKQFILKRKYCLLGDEQGLGKTLTAISAMVEVKGVALVICPAFLRENWKAEVKKFSNLSCKIVKSKESYDTVPQVIISSYSNAKNIPTDIMFDFIVCDESHYIKTYTAARTRAVVNLVRSCMPEYFLAMTGTPLSNNITEFFSILKILSCCPSGTNGIPIAQKSQMSFSMKFSNAVTRNIKTKSKNGRTTSVKVTNFNGVRNLDLLKTYLRGKFLRRLASKVLDLPSVVDVPFIVTDKSPLDKEMYDAYESYINGRSHPEDHITHIKIKCALRKVAHTISLAEDLVNQGEKVVIFSDNREPVLTIVKGLKDKGIAADYILGGMDTGVRQRLVDAFQESNAIMVLVGSIGAMGTGLNLTAARHMIFNDMSWVPAYQSQARKRIDRIGQERKVTITNMLSGQFDQSLMRKLNNKIKNISEIVSKG